MYVQRHFCPTAIAGRMRDNAIPLLTGIAESKVYLLVYESSEGKVYGCVHITDLLAGLGTMGLSWRLGVELGYQWTDRTLSGLSSVLGMVAGAGVDCQCLLSMAPEDSR